jgi:hypothetical protein
MLFFVLRVHRNMQVPVFCSLTCSPDRPPSLQRHAAFFNGFMASQTARIRALDRRTAVTAVVRCLGHAHDVSAICRGGAVPLLRGCESAAAPHAWLQQQRVHFSAVSRCRRWGQSAWGCVSLIVADEPEPEPPVGSICHELHRETAASTRARGRPRICWRRPPRKRCHLFQARVAHVPQGAQQLFRLHNGYPSCVSDPHTHATGIKLANHTVDFSNCKGMHACIHTYIHTSLRTHVSSSCESSRAVSAASASPFSATQDSARRAASRTYHAGFFVCGRMQSCISVHIYL